MTRSRALLSATLAAGLAATGPCGVDARATVIPEGVRVAGLDVGGLSPSAAAERIEAAFGDRLRAPIRVRAAGHRSTLTARLARLRFDPLRSALRADRAARRAADPSTVDVQPWVRFSESRLRAFARRVARPVARRPRNARLRYSVTRLSIRPARAGYDIDRRACVDASPPRSATPPRGESCAPHGARSSRMSAGVTCWPATAPWSRSTAAASAYAS